MYRMSFEESILIELYVSRLKKYKQDNDLKYRNEYFKDKDYLEEIKDEYLELAESSDDISLDELTTIIKAIGEMLGDDVAIIELYTRMLNKYKPKNDLKYKDHYYRDKNYLEAIKDEYLELAETSDDISFNDLTTIIKTIGEMLSNIYENMSNYSDL